MTAKKWGWLFTVVAILLLIPLIAMQFTNEVKWTSLDFFTAAILLSSTGIAGMLLWQKFKSKKMRVIVSVGLMILLLLVWAELAVGIFN